MPTLRPLSFEEHFEEQYPRIVAELDYVLGNVQLARDVAQEAFIQQFARWLRISHYDKPGAWVRRVALRIAMRSKAKRSREDLRDSTTLEAVSATTIDVDTVMDVRRAIEQLSPSQRAAVVLHYYRDFPVAEVAHLLGCKEATAKVHLHNARIRLAELLVNYAPGNSSEEP